MADLPRCPEPACPAPKSVLLEDRDDFWVVGCETCRSVRVITKPRAAARYRFEAKMRRLGKVPDHLRKIYSIPRIGGHHGR